MFPVLRYISSAALYPEGRARRLLVALASSVFSYLLILYILVPSILDISPPTFGYQLSFVPLVFADLFASTRALFYALSSTAISPPDQRCLPYLGTSTFAICVDNLFHKRLVSLMEVAFVPPSLENVIGLLVAWAATLPANQEFVLQALIGELSPATPASSAAALAAELDWGLKAIREKIKSDRDETQRRVAATSRVIKEIEAENGGAERIRVEIASLSSSLKEVQRREATSSAELESQMKAKRDSDFAAVKRQDTLRAELASHDLQLDDARAHMANLLATLDTAKLEAAAAKQFESQTAEAQLAEAQAMFDVTGLAFECTLSDLEDTNSRLHAELEHLKTDAKVTQDTDNAALDDILCRLELADNALRQLRDEEADLDATQSSVDRKQESLLLKVSTVKAAILDATYEQATAEAALLGSSLDYHRADLQVAGALEKEVAELEDALRDAVTVQDGLRGSLEFTVVEHGLHTEYCDKERDATVQQLQFLEAWVATDQATVDTLAHEASSLPSDIAFMRQKFEEERKGLSCRLSQITQGYTAEDARLKELKPKLDEALTAHAKEKFCHRQAVLSYHRCQDLDESFADDLIRVIDERKLRIEVLEARHAALQGAQNMLDDAQRKLDATMTDIVDVDEDISDTHAETVLLTAQLADAKLRMHAFRREVEGQEKAYTKKLNELKEDSATLRQRIPFEGKIHRAERSRTLDRVKLREAAVHILSPAGMAPEFAGRMGMGCRDMVFRDPSNQVFRSSGSG